MARKLYIFGIGGTGSRVIKSLTMLLASGCKFRNGFDTVVPILIDPDNSNGDLNRTKDILRLYQEIRNQVDKPDDFFGQELKTINELADDSPNINPDYFQFRLEGVNENTFGQYIGFDSLSDDFRHSRDDKNFIRLLYSETNLKSELNIGFKGNPNMGSIVLNQFTNAADFQRFGQSFGPDDAIFIINSIFGGTGAAGFPLLLKNLRGNDKLPRAAQIKDSPVGGITYLPYFTLNKQDEVNWESFEEKAKIAIDYYNRTIINQNKINVLYFIGNRGSTNVLNYAVGGQEQRNNAHFLELAGALAIFDFCNEIEAYTCNNGISVNGTRIKEFGIERDSEIISFNELNLNDTRQISMPLTKFRLYTEYLRIGLPIALNISRWTKSNIKLIPKNKNSVLDMNYFESSEYKNQIEAFNGHFIDWIAEMEDNKPSFSPFTKITHSDALNLVKDKIPKGDPSFKAVDIENCRLIDDPEIRSSAETLHTTLIKLFGRSTQKIISKRILINK